MCRTYNVSRRKTGVSVFACAVLYGENSFSLHPGLAEDYLYIQSISSVISTELNIQTDNGQTIHNNWTLPTASAVTRSGTQSRIHGPQSARAWPVPASFPVLSPLFLTQDQQGETKWAPLRHPPGCPVPSEPASSFPSNSL